VDGSIAVIDDSTPAPRPKFGSNRFADVNIYLLQFNRVSDQDSICQKMDKLLVGHGPRPNFLSLGSAAPSRDGGLSMSITNWCIKSKSTITELSRKTGIWIESKN